MRTKVWAFYVEARKTKEGELLAFPSIFVPRKCFTKKGWEYYMNHIEACILSAGYTNEIHIERHKMQVDTSMTPLDTYDGICEKIKKFISEIDERDTYVPRRGTLTKGTRVDIDWKNPKNRGISGAANNTIFVVDILRSETEPDTVLYILGYYTPSGNPYVPHKLKTMKPMTADELFSRWAITYQPIDQIDYKDGILRSDDRTELESLTDVPIICKDNDASRAEQYSRLMTTFNIQQLFTNLDNDLFVEVARRRWCCADRHSCNTVCEMHTLEDFWKKYKIKSITQ